MEVGQHPQVHLPGSPEVEVRPPQLHMRRSTQLNMLCKTKADIWCRDLEIPQLTSNVQIPGKTEVQVWDIELDI